MPEDDKYPEESDRRRFVKGVVGSATLAGVGTATTGIVNSLTPPSGGAGGLVKYYGIENTAGPAPRAMPQIPVRIDDEGYLQGLWPEVKQKTTEAGNTYTIAETKLADVTYTNRWFQYCGVQTYPGVDPEADQDNYFRYASGSPYSWQQEEVEAGNKVHVDDFSDYDTWGNDIGTDGIGKPAMVTWRSQDVSSSSTMPVQILRSTRIEKMAGDSAWLQASSREGFIAWLDKCTHFCCVPGFKTSEYEGADNAVYCQCHQSIYDPFSIVQKSFAPLPRPSEG